MVSSRAPHTGINLVYANHQAGCLYDGVSRFALCELEFVGRLIGDRGSDNLPADINSYMGGSSALLHVDDLTLELIARAEFHRTSSDLHHSSQFIAAGCIIRSDQSVRRLSEGCVAAMVKSRAGIHKTIVELSHS